jgi:PAS domain S-box-containing protein
MPKHYRTLLPRLTLGAGLVFAAGAGLLSQVVLPLVTNSPAAVPFALAGLAVGAVVLAAAAVAGERRAVHEAHAAQTAEARRQADELRLAVDLLATKEEEVGRLRAACDRLAAEQSRQRDLLRESEDRLRFALRANRMLGWEYDLETGRVLRTEPLYEWLGLPADAPLESLEDFRRHVHPEDVPGYARALAAATAGGELESEYRLVRADGSAVWVRSFGRAVLGSDGRPWKLVGVHLDVTDRREREDRLRLLESAVVHARDAVVILAADPRPGAGRSVLYVNDEFTRMTGYDREEVVGRSLHVLRGPESDPVTLEQLRQALDDGRPLRVELRNHRKDGTGYWVDLSLVPVPDQTGRCAHWVMIQRDVTDRKRAEDDLRRSEELFRGIFQGTAAGVSLTDPAGRFVSVNPAFAAMLGRSADELRQLTPKDVTHPDDWAVQEPLFAEVLAGTRDRLFFPKRYVRPDGAVVYAELSLAAVRGADGGYEYGLGVSLDVTERQRLEEQLRQSQKMEAVGQMAGGVAHDFNNLLTGLIGNLALVDFPAGDPNRPLVAAAEQAAARAADLTRKLLGFARRNQLVIGPVAPAAAFDEVAGLLRRTLDPRIEIGTAVATGCGPVLADPTLLNQAVLNLCLNARDAMAEGGTLTLSATPVEVTEGDAAGRPDARPGHFIRVSVADTGSGMTDAVRARAFEPFYTTKGVGKGTGLGLPMVHGIVKQHQGWVECATAPGTGTRIDLYLPPAPAAATQPWVPPRAVPENNGGRLSSLAPWPAGRGLAADTPPPVAALKDRTILLVDDEAMIRALGRAVLERSGFRVLTAEDGAEAVEVFDRERANVDLVIMDVTMPRMSGRDAYRELVRLDPEARVLFSTGYSAEELAELDGAVGLLNKPYRPDELLAAVAEALTAGPAA